jgi:hypothetical protein
MHPFSPVGISAEDLKNLGRRKIKTEIESCEPTTDKLKLRRVALHSRYGEEW